MTHPSELHTWLAIPDADLRDVQRANVGPIRPFRSAVAVVAIGVFLLEAMWLLSLRPAIEVFDERDVAK